MPQLNPTPWFITGLYLWLMVFLFLCPAMVSIHPVPLPYARTTALKTHPWLWPWL